MPRPRGVRPGCLCLALMTPTPEPTPAASPVVSDVLLGGLMTGGFTLLAAALGLIGLYIVQRFETDRAARQLRHARILAVREPLGIFVSSGRYFFDTTGFRYMAAELVTQKRFMELAAQFEELQPLLPDRRDMQRTRYEIAALVDDQQTDRLLETFDRHVRDLPKQTENVFQHREGTRERRDAVTAAIAYCESGSELVLSVHARIAQVIREA